MGLVADAVTALTIRLNKKSKKGTMPLFFGFLLALLTALIDLAGDVVVKAAADKGRFLSVATGVGVSLYAITAVCWYFMMRHVGLGTGAVLYSMLGLIATVAIGAIWFGDAFGTRQVFGMAFAVAAMFMMSDAS